MPGKCHVTKVGRMVCACLDCEVFVSTGELQLLPPSQSRHEVAPAVLLQCGPRFSQFSVFSSSSFHLPALVPEFSLETRKLGKLDVVLREWHSY